VAALEEALDDELDPDEPEEPAPDVAGVLEDEEPFVEAVPFEPVAPASEDPVDFEASDPPEEAVAPAVSLDLPLLRESLR
jgi:hypothetical protein